MVLASEMSRRLASLVAPYAGRERIAGIVGVHDAAALHAVGGTERAVGIMLALEEAVVARVGVDDAADRAVLGGDLGLDAAPRAAVAGDDDGSLDRDAHALQLFVVFAHAVVHIDERAGDVAVFGVGVVGGQLLGGLRRRGIDSDRRLLQLGGELRGLEHLELALFRRRKEHIEGLDVRVEAEFLELGEHPLGVVLVVGRADVVGARAEALHVVAQELGVGNGAELRSPSRVRRRSARENSRQDWRTRSWQRSRVAARQA